MENVTNQWTVKLARLQKGGEKYGGGRKPKKLGAGSHRISYSDFLSPKANKELTCRRKSTEAGAQTTLPIWKLC